MSDQPSRVPVTVLTGFLGAGKTTLLNRILTAQHGKRIAVIENEFGEIGVDHELVVNAEEELFEMNNGCVCCTVRGDLIRILGNLIKRRDKFDSILIETTGLANPGPVAQTFYADDEMQSKLRLDGIVTVVDAKHLLLHLDESEEARQQIAFADVLLLNKTDLVSPEELTRLEERIHCMNAVAKIYRTKNVEIELEKLLNIGGFDLDRALEIDPKFLEPESSYEWCGVFDLAQGDHQLKVDASHDQAVEVMLAPIGSGDAHHELHKALETAAAAAAKSSTSIACGGTVPPTATPCTLDLFNAPCGFVIPIAAAGRYAFFTEHAPHDGETRLIGPDGPCTPLRSHHLKHHHHHDDHVSSVGITTQGDLDVEKFNAWMQDLLANKGQDIFRMKGVLSIKGSDERFVFQGVHMLFDGRADRPWGNEPRHNALIFIGRKLDRAALNEGFRRCLA
ncbi:MAG TPA: GTP-binding protein [Pirellulales bacterium]